MNTIARLLNIDENRTPGDLLLGFFRRLARMLYETNCAFWLERPLGGTPAVEPAIEVRLAYDEPVKTLQWIRECGEKWMLPPREAEVGLAEGHSFVNVKYRGRIIGYLKLARNRVYVHDYKQVLELPAGHAFIYDTYVNPEYRGLHIARYLVADAMRRLEGEGFRTIGCHIPPWNSSSLNLYGALGFRRTKYVRFVRLLWLPLKFTRPLGREGQ